MAKLSLQENERELITQKVCSLVSGFDRLEAIDTADTKPLVTVLDCTNIMREDIAAKNFTRDEVLANAPEQYDGYFQIPRTL